MQLIDYLRYILNNNILINCQKAFLRGSYASSCEKVGSDIDLLIISNDFFGVSIPKRKELIRNIFLQEKTSTFIDSICLTEEEFEKVIISNRQKFVEDLMIEVL